MKILITGAAGFIGSYLSYALAGLGHEVVGIDNMNHYYDIQLKLSRLDYFKIDRSKAEYGKPIISQLYPNCSFIMMDITDKQSIDKLFEDNGFDVVCNLAAQAGVRYSIENPYSYVESNIIGFMNILEACRHNPVKHLVFASSSSIYGMNKKVPYSEDDKTDQPVSLYAATKKSGELLAFSYSNLYHIPCTGLRFFTVYGPWGRPDMAPFLFMNAIVHHKPITVFNKGEMKRDFTYIMDIIQGINLVLPSPPTTKVPFRVYNIGNSCPIPLMTFIHTIEDVVGIKADCIFAGMQAGDVKMTYADISKLQHDFGYHPETPLNVGIQKLYNWYKGYYLKEN
jgi:UDP-glucuronate 4-epimerase